MTDIDTALPVKFTELVDELRDILLDGTNHDGGEDGYNRSAGALEKAPAAAFNAFASMLGVSGFQASWAALAFYGDVMHVDGPYTIVQLQDALYPQYDLPGRLARFLDENKAWLAEEAQKKLDAYESRPSFTSDDGTQLPTVHPDVVAHWRKLVAAVLG